MAIIVNWSIAVQTVWPTATGSHALVEVRQLTHHRGTLQQTVSLESETNQARGLSTFINIQRKQLHNLAIKTVLYKGRDVGCTTFKTYGIVFQLRV